MCDGFVIRLADGNEICIHIYREVIRWPPEDPEPDPFRKFYDDLVSLTVINEAAARLQDEGLRTRLSEVAQASVQDLATRLPDGVRLGDGLLRTASAR